MGIIWGASAWSLASSCWVGKEDIIMSDITVAMMKIYHWLPFEFDGGQYDLSQGSIYFNKPNTEGV